MSKVRIIESIHKLITTVHIAIRYKRYLPIDELYMTNSDKHIFKCYSRLYYIVSGQYLYCEKFTLMIGDSAYHKRLNSFDVCWPRYWLMEIGTFNVLPRDLNTITNIDLKNDIVEIYNTLSFRGKDIYTIMLEWYGITRAELSSNISNDIIVINKSDLPMLVNPANISEYSLNWYRSGKPLFVYPDCMRIAVAGCKMMHAAVIDKSDGDELFIRKHSKFCINRVKKMNILNMIS